MDIFSSTDPLLAFIRKANRQGVDVQFRSTLLMEGFDVRFVKFIKPLGEAYHMESRFNDLMLATSERGEKYLVEFLERRLEEFLSHCEGIERAAYAEQTTRLLSLSDIRKGEWYGRI